MRFLVFGTGCVGRVYGGFLLNAGHEVTFLTRPEQRAELEQDGITLVPESNEPGPSMSISDARFVDHVEGMNDFDFVFVCVRADQRNEVLSAFEPHDCSQKGVILTFPAWRPTLEPWRAVFGSCHYMFPGVMALFRGGDVVYRHSKTKLAPLFDSLEEESAALSTLLTQAGLLTETDPALLMRFQTVFAMGFPVLVAIALHGYKPERFAGDPAAIRLAAQGAKEGLAALKAAGEPLAGLAHAVRLTPEVLMRLGLRWTGSMLSGFIREMLEVHFKKIHRQTLLLLGELVALPGADTARHPAIDELLRRAHE